MNPDLKISEDAICRSLNSYFVGNCKYKLANAFVFKHDWESDFFVQKQNGYSYEFEVKISRSDFLADKKKVAKHSVLQNGFYVRKSRVWDGVNGLPIDNYIIKENQILHSFRPNKFFYVVPDGMITVDELPKYAGLFYYGSGIDYNCNLKKIKDAPFIHKEVLDFERVLCNKFYNYWLDEKRKASMLCHENEALKSTIEFLSQKQNNPL